MVATSTLVVENGAPDEISSRRETQSLLPLPIPRPVQILPVSYSSAWSLPFALPTTVAVGFGVWRWRYEGVNARIGQWVLDILDANRAHHAYFASSSADCGNNTLPLTGTEEGVVEESAIPSSRISGWLFMDFFHEPNGLAPLLVEMNFV